MVEYRKIKEFSGNDLNELFLSVNWSSGHYPDKLVVAMRNSHSVWSAWEGNELVGLINALSDGVMTAYFHYLLVKPEYQNHGIGKHLLALMQNEYAELLIKVLISVDNEIGFYHHCGFDIGSGKTPMFETNLKL